MWAARKSLPCAVTMARERSRVEQGAVTRHVIRDTGVVGPRASGAPAAEVPSDPAVRGEDQSTWTPPSYTSKTPVWTSPSKMGVP